MRIVVFMIVLQTVPLRWSGDNMGVRFFTARAIPLEWLFALMTISDHQKDVAYAGTFCWAVKVEGVS